MTLDEAIQKAVKLLRLSQSDSANEAATAAAMAQKIIDTYRLDAAMLEGKETEKPKESIGLGGALDKKANTWRRYLARVICDANQVMSYVQFSPEGKTIGLIGRQSDVQTVRYMYELLLLEVERFTDRDAKGLGRVYMNNYRMGMIETIAKRMKSERERTVEEMQAREKAAQAAAGAADTSIVLVNKALAKLEQGKKEVESWVSENMKMRSLPAPKLRYNHDARENGRRAGHEVNLNRSRGALP